MNPRIFFVSLLGLSALFLIQITAGLVVPGPLPQLMITGLVLVSLWGGPFWGFCFGCFAGLLAELFRFGVFGQAVALYGIIGWLCGVCAFKIFRESLFSVLLLSLAACGAFFLVEGILMGWRGDWTAEGHFFLEAIHWKELTLTALFSPAIFWVFQKAKG